VLLNNKRNGANHVVSLTSGSNRHERKLAESNDSVATTTMKDSLRVRSVELGASATAASRKRARKGAWGKKRRRRRRIDDRGSTHVPVRVSLAKKIALARSGSIHSALPVSRRLSGRPNFDLTFLMNGPWHIHRCIRARDVRSADVSFLLFSLWSKTCRGGKGTLLRTSSFRKTWL